MKEEKKERKVWDWSLNTDKDQGQVHGGLLHRGFW